MSQPTGASGTSPSLGQIAHVALDMDGTIYSGSTLFPFTLPFLELLRSLGIGFTFLTNNSSKSVRDYQAVLGRFGIHASPENIYTSSLAAIDYLRASHPGCRRLFVVGTRSLREELAGEGFVCVEEDAPEPPDIVLVGFDTDLTYSRLCRAAYWIQEGKPFVATHPDRVCPTDQPTVLVDCGAVCAALASATGRAPDMVLGKPSASMLTGILARHGLRPDQLAMAGDRLYTDMEMARRTGAMGVLVLTGETRECQARAHQPAPGLIVNSLEDFGRALASAHGKQW